MTYPPGSSSVDGDQEGEGDDGEEEEEDTSAATDDDTFHRCFGLGVAAHGSITIVLGPGPSFPVTHIGASPAATFDLVDIRMVPSAVL